MQARCSAWVWSMGVAQGIKGLKYCTSVWLLVVLLGMADNGESEKELEEEDQTPRYFKPLMTRDKKERDMFLDMLTNSLKFWHRRSVSENDAVASHLLQVHTPTILRLSITCPFSDVRTKLKETLKLLEEVVGTKHLKIT